MKKYTTYHYLWELTYAQAFWIEFVEYITALSLVFDACVQQGLQDTCIKHKSKCYNMQK